MKKETVIARASNHQKSEFANIFDLVYPESKAFDRLIPIQTIRSMQKSGVTIQWQNLDMSSGEQPGGAAGDSNERQMTYQNISQQWGDNVAVTVDDVRQQAVIFGLEADLVTSDDDGIYYDGDLIAEAVHG